MTDVAVDIARFINKADEEFPELTMSSDNPGVQGNLFYHKMPPLPDFAVSVQKYEGAEPDETFRNPFHERHPRIQILVRHADSLFALNYAEKIMKFLGVVKDQEIEGTKYSRIKSVGEPFEIGPDSSQRQQAVTNLEVSFYDSVGS